MKKPIIAVVAGLFVLTANPLFAETNDGAKAVPQGDAKAKSAGHCEKTNADGSEEDIEAKDKADCKAQGGKWSKKSKGDHNHK